MTKLKIFEAVMKKAKANGYIGPDAEYELGKIVNGTNIYAIIFRKDFAKALWGDKWLTQLQYLVSAEDKWKYIKENALN